MKWQQLFLLAHVSHALLVKSPNNASSKALQSTFQDVAKENSWGSSESISGLGSEMGATSTARACLGNWITKYKVGLFMDVPCGDANWQGAIPGMDSIKYQGYDIAKHAVEAAQSKNQQHTNMKFGQFDLCSGVPPGKPDLFMMRDVIQHLPLKNGREMLVNAKRSGAKWLVVSSYTGYGSNKDISPGAFYENDIHAAPFNMPAAEEDCDNYASDHSSGQWFPHSRLELIDFSKWSEAGGA